MVRQGTREDLPAILDIYAAARRYMRETGNPTQWGESYPFSELVEEDVERGRLYVACGADGIPHGAFVLQPGEEPSYTVIDGAWMDESPYATIHRLAGDGTMRGVFAQCLDFCKRVCPHLRADTHPNNKTMRHLLEKHSFVPCGTVNLDKQDGDTLRLAYEYLPKDEEE